MTSSNAMPGRLRPAGATASRADSYKALRELSFAERRDALEVILETEFKAALLMTDDDELPFDQSYFDLGLTSLSITDLKERFEELFEVEIDTTLLFNTPTVERLLDYLTERIGERA